MGMFDSLYVPCPKCGKNIEFQSKAWDCMMDSWRSFDEAPAAVLFDVMNDPHYHVSCGTWVALVDPAHPPGWRPQLTARTVKPPNDPPTHTQGFKWWPDGQEFTFDDLEEPLPLNVQGEREDG